MARRRLHRPCPTRRLGIAFSPDIACARKLALNAGTLTMITVKRCSSPTEVTIVRLTTSHQALCYWKKLPLRRHKIWCIERI